MLVQGGMLRCLSLCSSLHVVSLCICLGLRNSRWASSCYGLSALLPSRVELQQQEIASLQLLGRDFLLQLQQQLQDYRRYFEPQVLPLALSTWQGVMQRLLLLPAERNSRGEGRGGKTKRADVWTKTPEGWVSCTLEALQREVGTYDQPEEQREHALAREEGTTQDGSWVWGLPALLRGPSQLHDMLRCFIYRSLSAAAGRFLGSHVSKLLKIVGEDGEMSRRALKRDGLPDDEISDTSAEPLGDGAQAEAEEDDILCGLANGIDSLRGHVQSELLLYSDVFAPLLPLRGEHPLLVLAAATGVLLSVVPLVLRCADKADEDPKKRGLPARGGRAVLSALAAFERLIDEVRFAYLSLPLYGHCVLVPAITAILYIP